MIRVPITYTNFDDEVVTENHYFHLSKAELIEMAQSTDGEDFATKLQRIGKSNDGMLIMKTFTEIIGSAYGQRVDGSGSEFYKNPELTQRFLGSLAFDQLLMDLVTNTVSAAAFTNGLLPSGLDKMGEIAARTAKAAKPAEETWFSADDESGLKDPRDDTGDILPWAFREPTEKELMNMTKPQMLDVMRRKTSDWKPPAKV